MIRPLFPALLVFGAAFQTIFVLRALVLARRGEIPGPYHWRLALVGALGVAAYALAVSNAVLLVGQAAAGVLYVYQIRHYPKQDEP